MVPLRGITCLSDTMDFHIHHHLAPSVEAKLDQILTALRGLNLKENTIMATLATLTTQVTANTDAEASAIQLLTNISAALKAAASDPTAIAALATQLETSRAALAAAVVANTPAAA